MEKKNATKEYTFSFFLMLKNNIYKAKQNNKNVYINKNGLVFTDKDGFIKNNPSEVFVSVNDLDFLKFLNFKRHREDGKESEEKIEENKKNLSEMSVYFDSLFPEKKEKEVVETINKIK